MTRKSLLFRQFIKKPGTVGTLCSSSPALAKVMVEKIDIHSARYIAELGPGTGAITASILKQITSDSHFFAIELDKTIYEEFKKHHPDVIIYNDTAENLNKIIRHQNIPHLDIVISGLPWSVFSEKNQTLIIKEVTTSLKENGYFTTFAYIQGIFLPSARRFKKLLKNNFSSVEISKVVWNNLPPAFVYRCRK